MTRFKPTTAQLEILISHAQARVPATVTARVLGVGVEDLRELARRLEIGRRQHVQEPDKIEVERPSIWAAFHTMNK